MRKNIIAPLAIIAFFGLSLNSVHADSIILRPAGAYNSNLERFGASSNYQCVDEVSSDGDTTYVYNDGVDTILRDLYVAEALLEIPEGNITNVTVYQISRKDTSSSVVEAHGYIRANGSTNGADGIVFTTSYQTFTTVFTTNPGTDSAWEWCDFDTSNFRFGIEIYNEDSSKGRCTQCWVVINYEPISNETNETNNTGSSGYVSSDLNWTLIFGVVLAGGGIGGIAAYVSKKRRN